MKTKGKGKLKVGIFTIAFLGLSFFLLYSFTGRIPYCKMKALLPADTKISVREQLMDTTLADGFDFPFGDGAGGGTYKDVKTGKKYSYIYIYIFFFQWLDPRTHALKTRNIYRYIYIYIFFFFPHS